MSQAIGSTRVSRSVDSDFKSRFSNRALTQHNFQGFTQSLHSKRETVPPICHAGFILHPLQFIIQSASCNSRLRILTGGLVSNPQTNKPSPVRYRQSFPTTPTLLLLTGGLCASQMEVG